MMTGEEFFGSYDVDQVENSIRCLLLQIVLALISILSLDYSRFTLNLGFFTGHPSSRFVSRVFRFSLFLTAAWPFWSFVFRWATPANISIHLFTGITFRFVFSLLKCPFDSFFRVELWVNALISIPLFLPVTSIWSPLFYHLSCFAAFLFLELRSPFSVSGTGIPLFHFPLSGKILMAAAWWKKFLQLHFDPRRFCSVRSVFRLFTPRLLQNFSSGGLWITLKKFYTTPFSDHFLSNFFISFFFFEPV